MDISELQTFEGSAVIQVKRSVGAKILKKNSAFGTRLLLMVDLKGFQDVADVSPLVRIGHFSQRIQNSWMSAERPNEQDTAITGKGLLEARRQQGFVDDTACKLKQVSATSSPGKR
jgi:hypothetical protein